MKRKICPGFVVLFVFCGCGFFGFLVGWLVGVVVVVVVDSFPLYFKVVAISYFVL